MSNRGKAKEIKKMLADCGELEDIRKRGQRCVTLPSQPNRVECLVESFPEKLKKIYIKGENRPYGQSWMLDTFILPEIARDIRHLPQELKTSIEVKSETVPSGWNIGLLFARSVTPLRKCSCSLFQSFRLSSYVSMMQLDWLNLTLTLTPSKMALCLAKFSRALISQAAFLSQYFGAVLRNDVDAIEAMTARSPTLTTASKREYPLVASFKKNLLVALIQFSFHSTGLKKERKRTGPAVSGASIRRVFSSSLSKIFSLNLIRRQLPWAE